jgi:hypothetical protein
MDQRRKSKPWKAQLKSGIQGFWLKGRGRKMNKPYFIMAYSQDGERGIPITTYDDWGGEQVVFFSSEKEARTMAKDQLLCAAFGYEVFNMEEGIR